MYDKFGKVPDQHDGNQTTNMTATRKKKQGLGDTYLSLSVESLSASSEYMERM